MQKVSQLLSLCNRSGEETEELYPSQLWVVKAREEENASSNPVRGSGMWGCERSPRAARARDEAKTGRPLEIILIVNVLIYLLCHLLGLNSVLLALEENLFHYLLGCCSSCLFPKRKKIRRARA